MSAFSLITAFPNGVSSFGVPVLGSVGGVPFTGNYYFVDPVNGLDGNPGTSPGTALQSLYAAHNICTAGNNDVVILIGNGATSGTARLSKAAAQAITPAATAGTLNWTKNATHLIGVTAPTGINARARIAPPTGVYTAATFGSGNFVSVTASGCYFANFSVFNGFSTGGTNQIAWTDSGGRNAYSNVTFVGMGDAASAADTGSHSLLISGSTGENSFYHCQIGSDYSAARSSGVSEMAFTGGSPRNRFEDCQISTWAGAAGCFWVGIPASGIDRYALFSRCVFNNATGGTTMTVGFSIDAAAGGVVLMPNCLSSGATKITTTGLAYTNLAAGAAGGGLGVAIT